MSNSKIVDDPRIDPRIKALLGALSLPAAVDVASREEILEQANSEQAKAAVAALKSFMDMCDNEDVAPSAGLTITTREPSIEATLSSAVSVSSVGLAATGSSTNSRRVPS